MELLLGQEVGNSKLLEKVEQDLFNNSRIIYLNEDISDITINNIVPLIHHINEQDKGIPVEQRIPLKIFVTTYGGDAYAGWNIVNAIQTSETPVYTICDSYSMSMGVPVFLAGNRRYLGQFATLLYHELRGGLAQQGTREDIKRLDKEFDRLQKVYDNYITSKTTIPQETLVEHQEKVSDWYISFEEAQKYEMFTHVYEGLHKL